MASKPPSKSTAAAGGPPAPPKAPPKPSPKKPGGRSERAAKSFSVAPLSGDNEGEKILIYGKSGMGKTSLAAQVDGAVFIPLDDGARKVYNPNTGRPVQAIAGVEDWQDLRDATQQATKIVPAGGTLVIDTATRAQPLAEQWVIENIKLEKGGQAKNLEAFGFGKGYRHVLDQFRLWLTDLDAVVRSGRNVVLVCQLDQAIVANPEGADYFCDVPKLIENKQGPVRSEVCEWSDQIMRIGYLNFEVQKDSDDSKAGKVSGDAERAIFTGGAQHYLAKSRPINGHRLPPIVSFESEADSSVWQYILHGYVAAESA